MFWESSKCKCRAWSAALSTLRRTVEAPGGQLTLIATFPDQPPMALAAGTVNVTKSPAARNA